MENQQASVWYDQLITAIDDPYFYGILAGLLIFTGLVLLNNLLVQKTEPESEKAKPSLDRSQAKTEDSAAVSLTEAAAITEIKATDNASWLSKLHQGLSKTRNSLQSGMSSLFQGKKIDDATLESLHETLFRSDIGVATADKLVEHVNNSLKGKNSSWEEVKSELHQAAHNIMSTTNQPLNNPSSGPQVILVVGVNGVGKTTSIGKLAAHFMSQDKTVLLCAADTFRAAAIDQLKVWGERLGTKVIAHQQGSDPAAVAYDGVKAAIARKSDVLIIDTAGRLHSKNDLMQELNKIKRVIGKDLPEAPHETWLVIDATTGQNAFQQVKAFDDVAKLTGIIVTKLDGTAKGGVIIGISDQFKHPIRYIGVGEKAADLREFSPKDYLDTLFADA
ncbi:MAG: signal recognition particle-docking protein FtsY [Oligoflexales bacterium]|nr:signal recognition particle-docking protein FtsY [Oligoflexales bacterium]